jgi:hypothetical protein
MIPISVLYAYPELSNHHLKTQKRFARGFLAAETSQIIFCSFKWQIISSIQGFYRKQEKNHSNGRIQDMMGRETGQTNLARTSDCKNWKILSGKF